MHSFYGQVPTADLTFSHTARVNGLTTTTITADALYHTNISSGRQKLGVPVVVAEITDDCTVDIMVPDVEGIEGAAVLFRWRPKGYTAFTFCASVQGEQLYMDLTGSSPPALVLVQQEDDADTVYDYDGYENVWAPINPGDVFALPDFPFQVYLLSRSQLDALESTAYKVFERDSGAMKLEAVDASKSVSMVSTGTQASALSSLGPGLRLEMTPEIAVCYCLIRDTCLLEPFCQAVCQLPCPGAIIAVCRMH